MDGTLNYETAPQIAHQIELREENITCIQRDLKSLNKGSYEWLETVSNVVYVFAGVSTVAIAGLNILFPGSTAILDIANDFVTAAPNVLGGVLFGASFVHGINKTLKQNKLKEQLSKEEEELEILKIKAEHKKIAQRAERLRKIRNGEDAVSDDNQEERTFANTYLKLLTARKQSLEISDKLRESSKKIRTVRYLFGILSSVFYVAMAVLAFTPVGAALAPLAISAPLVEGILGVVGSTILVGSYFVAKGEHVNRVYFENQLRKQKQQVSELEIQLKEEEIKQIEGIMKTQKELLARQRTILEDNPLSKIKPKTDEEMRNTFKEIGELNNELLQLKKRLDPIEQKKAQLAEQDAKYASYQKTLAILSGILCVIAAAILLASIAYPPLGGVVLGGVAVTTICIVACNVAAVALTLVGSVILAKRREAIKKELQDLDTQQLKGGMGQAKDKGLSSELSEEDKIKQKITSKLNSIDEIIDKQNKEVIGVTSSAKISDKTPTIKKISDTPKLYDKEDNKVDVTPK